MKEFGIKTSAQLKAKYLDAMIEKGEIPAIVTTRGPGKKAETKSKSILVNKRGSIIVPKELVEEMGFKVGNEFMVRKSKAGVSLKKM